MVKLLDSMFCSFVFPFSSGVTFIMVGDGEGIGVVLEFCSSACIFSTEMVFGAAKDSVGEMVKPKDKGFLGVTLSLAKATSDPTSGMGSSRRANVPSAEKNRTNA